MYHVKASNEEKGLIDIYANGTFIARVTGLIGYPGGDPSPVKFKFGHYRDKMLGTSRLLFDRVCMAESSSVCDPELDILR